ncbi:prepilin-type N-terminal cleavage/methylation domain-containing protein [Lactobacillus equicursoris]|uniref:Prepilin-type N-terminal cleavage/methylation domain-containing protein n=1 Tax=Lactobacillus equicursoris TaxID=420645 RepID=A0A844FM58_9LACO|nr:prepilin-type N-terminal cleavage/methylation domain-containing protein [Lactobacillus equicursoris]MST79419.1 prepilin-type N-terminal cleavage/methylation domain-containing protein [Lactobacillus equicursoris]
MKMMKNRLEKKLQKLFPKKQPGFTLIEMVIVVAIIATLVLLISPNLLSQKEKADDRSKDAFVSTLQTQIQLYREDHDNTVPTSFKQMTDEHYLTANQQTKAEKNFTIKEVMKDQTAKDTGTK